MPENDEFLTQRPEGKEIETYSFSREDIKNIANEVLIDQADEVINEAIAEGKIILPPGGTKLYKHKFYITGGNILEFISPYNKKLKEQSIEEVKLCFGFDISGGSLGAVQGITIVKTENPTALTLYGLREIDSVVTKVSYTITSDSESDTITEL